MLQRLLWFNRQGCVGECCRYRCYNAPGNPNWGYLNRYLVYYEREQVGLLHHPSFWGYGLLSVKRLNLHTILQIFRGGTRALHLKMKRSVCVDVSLAFQSVQQRSCIYTWAILKPGWVPNMLKGIARTFRSNCKCVCPLFTEDVWYMFHICMQRKLRLSG